MSLIAEYISLAFLGVMVLDTILMIIVMIASYFEEKEKKNGSKKDGRNSGEH